MSFLFFQLLLSLLVSLENLRITSICNSQNGIDYQHPTLVQIGRDPKINSTLRAGGETRYFLFSLCSSLLSALVALSLAVIFAKSQLSSGDPRFVRILKRHPIKCL